MILQKYSFDFMEENKKLPKRRKDESVKFYSSDIFIFPFPGNAGLLNFFANLRRTNRFI